MTILSTATPSLLTRRGIARGALPAVVAGLTWLGGAASPAQYIPPGTTTPISGTPEREALEKVILEAPWSVGPLRLSPWIGVRDAQLVKNEGAVVAGEEGEDVTATAGAGLRAYLKTGSKVIWAAHALPEYVWWQDSASRRRLNGRYGLGAFGYFNRLTVELSGRQVEQQGFFSTEVQQLASHRQDLFRLAVALRLGHRLELFAAGQRQEVENLEDELPIFSRLDRVEESRVAGVRYRASGGWTVELALRDRTLDFSREARDLSSSGTAGEAVFDYRGSPLELRLAVRAWSLDPEPGSRFRGFEDLTGSLDAIWAPSRRLAILSYARRDLSFSLAPDQSHFVGDRVGARLELGVGRSTLSFFGEVGEDGFEPLVAGALERLDEVTAVGADLRFRTRELLAFSVRLARIEYDSNFDAFDRDVSTVGFALELGGALRRLTLGRAGGQW